MTLSEITTPYEQKQMYHYLKDGNTVKLSSIRVKLIRKPYYMSEPKTNEYGNTYADIYVWYPKYGDGCGIKLMNLRTDTEVEKLCAYNDDAYETPEKFIRTVTELTYPRMLEIFLVNEINPDLVPFLTRKRDEYLKAKSAIESEQRRTQERIDMEFVSEQNEILKSTVEKAVEILKHDGILKNETITEYRNRYDFSEYKLVNYIARKYGVKIPLKTQGWINSTLAEIKIENGEMTTYKRMSNTNPSNSIWKYMDELIKKIREEN